MRFVSLSFSLTLMTTYLNWNWEIRCLCVCTFKRKNWNKIIRIIKELKRTKRKFESNGTRVCTNPMNDHIISCSRLFLFCFSAFHFSLFIFYRFPHAYECQRKKIKMMITKRYCDDACWSSGFYFLLLL